MVKQPDVPFYRIYDFSKDSQMREDCESQKEKVDQIIKITNVIENSIPKDCDTKLLHTAANELMPAIKFIMSYAATLGMLFRPLLPELIKLRTGKEYVEPCPNDTNRVTPLISVIIPCYNYGKYLGEAVQSLVNQTYKNIEIIIVNDGSTDNSLEVATRLKEKYSQNRITIIDQEELRTACNF